MVSRFQPCLLIAGVDPLASSKGFWADMLGVGNFYFELGVQIVDVCLSTRAANGGLIAMEVQRWLRSLWLLGRVPSARLFACCVRVCLHVVCVVGGCAPRTCAPILVLLALWVRVLQDLLKRLRLMRGSRADVVGPDDVERAISKLAVLGNGFKLIEARALAWVLCARVR